jgi:uncharacterized coiled-coil DUF342 family protein
MEKDSNTSAPGLQEVLIQLGKMEANLDQDRKVIWGNGHPGLLDKMSDLSQCVTKLSEQMKNQTDKLDQLIQRIDEHKEIQSSVMVRVEKLENEVALLKAKGGWWKELLAMGLSLVALGASACGMIFR